ncbi:hypothetical protein ACFP2T_12630 [Plantactinospora solaniradicis]|uniref:Uncharacterized protein n=1 Tax=Plantactinospora solaniradicis TaxID=1723736 RepID=A0ABW1K706_9ACTN
MRDDHLGAEAGWRQLAGCGVVKLPERGALVRGSHEAPGEWAGTAADHWRRWWD